MRWDTDAGDAWYDCSGFSELQERTISRLRDR
jgi:hypothetical protein